MIITCEKCDISFNLDESLLKPSGSKVRCSKCRHIFTAYPPAPEKEPEIPEEVKVTSPDLEPDDLESDDDLDFSGLEQMLESDDSSHDEGSSGKDRFEAETAEIDDDVEEEIDISGLEHMLDSDAESEVSDDTVDDLDPSLDSDPLAEEKSTVADEDLEDLDLSLDLDESDEAEEVAGVAGDDPEDLDLSLDLDEPDEVEEVAGVAGDDPEDLDLSLDLDESDEAEEVAGVAGDDPGDLDLSLDLDESDEAEEVAGVAGDDLEDLDLSLDLDEPDEAEEVAGVAGDDPGDLDLSLDLDESGEAEEVAAAGDDLEDLDLELDDGGSEKTLESDLLSTKTVSAVEKDSDDLDIELDIDEEPERPGETLETTEELIDLAELEQTLEMELLSPSGDYESDGEPENVDLELADDDEDIIDEDKDEESLEPANDADVSDIEQMLDMDIEADVVSDEIELEFDIDGKPDDDQVSLEPDTTFVDEKESIVSEDQVVEEEAEKAAVKDDSKTKPVKERKVSTPVVVLIVIVLLACAAVGGYFLLESQGVIKDLNIPYISDLFTPGSKKDLGTVEALQSNVRSEFVDNSMLGKLFVISGQVKNSTSKTHHSVKVSAKLYATGKKLAKSRTVYAGNKLSKEELASNDLAAMNQRQANRFSSPGQPIRIKPGETIPFMIVIPNLPENLEEYKVVVSESTPE